MDEKSVIKTVLNVMADFALHLNKLISIMPFVAAIDLIDILVIRRTGCRIMLSFSYDV